jgi:hypothetical protein
LNPSELELRKYRKYAGSALTKGVPSVAGECRPDQRADAQAIGVNAYLYFYPLVMLDVTRRQMTNLPAGKAFGSGPPNTFNNIPIYPTASDKLVVRPNFDTLYSSAWLDLTKEPVIVSAPDTNGRYYLLPMLDMWTDVFASPGWRTTGTHAQHFLVAPAGWRPDLRDRLIEEFRLPKNTQRIDAPTPRVWIIGRTKTDAPQDYDAFHEIQAGFRPVPWGVSSCRRSDRISLQPAAAPTPLRERRNLEYNKNNSRDVRLKRHISN